MLPLRLSISDLSEQVLQPHLSQQWQGMMLYEAVVDFECDRCVCVDESQGGCLMGELSVSNEQAGAEDAGVGVSVVFGLDGSSGWVWAVLSVRLG